MFMRRDAHSSMLRAFVWLRQDSERKRAEARVSSWWPLPAVAYAACSSVHTAPQRSWNKRRCSARDTVSFRYWRKRKWSRSSS